MNLQGFHFEFESKKIFIQIHRSNYFFFQTIRVCKSNPLLEPEFGLRVQEICLAISHHKSYFSLYKQISTEIHIFHAKH